MGLASERRSVVGEVSESLSRLSYWLPGDLYVYPLNNRVGLLCGVGFPLRIEPLPARLDPAAGPMPCKIDGRLP